MKGEAEEKQGKRKKKAGLVEGRTVSEVKGTRVGWVCRLLGGERLQGSGLGEAI